MSRLGFRCSHIILQLVAVLGLASCAEETQSSRYDLPLRLNPLHLQGASDADSAAAWAAFDRDTGTRWSPQAGDLTIVLDSPRTLAYLKVFGPAEGTLELRTDAGVLATVNLGTLRSGWNRVTLPAGDAIERVQLSAIGVTSMPDVELWATEAPRPLLDSETLIEQIAYGRLDGQADVIATDPAQAVLGGQGNETCADFVFEVPRDPRVYRRAWLVYGSTGLYRPFVLSRSVNDSPKTHGRWMREDMAVGAFVEPIDPARLMPGLNWYQFCLPAGAEGSVILQDARFVGELDYGTNQIDAIVIGAADGTPTHAATSLLDPLSLEQLDVSANERIILAFERWTSPDAILLATDRADWRVECLDRNGAGVPLSTERTLDERLGVALVVDAGDTMCAGLSLSPTQDARVSFVTVAGSGARARVDWPRIVLASPREHFGRVAWVDGWVALPEGFDAPSVAVETTDAGATGVYGELLKRGGDRDSAWPVTVTARLSDGTTATGEFVLGRYADPTGIVEGSLGDRGTQLTPEESAERYGEAGQTVQEMVDPDADTSIRLGTHVGVDIPAGSVNGNGVVVSITHLDEAAVPPMDPAMINVTAPTDHGYEFLPHGQEFKGPVTILLPFDPALLPPGYTADDVHTFYFDPDAQRWKRLARARVDTDADGTGGTTQSLTDHFTTMVNAVLASPEHPTVASFNPNALSSVKSGDPGTKLAIISPPEASSSGGAALSYPIEIPPGRGNVRPIIKLDYSSGSGNGWLGMGWSAGMASVTIDTRFGAPRFDPTSETETYMLAGSQLAPFYHRGPAVARTSDTTVIGGETVKVFHTRVEGVFSKVIRHGDHPSNYWWEVIDKNGTRFFYGGDPEGGVAADSTLASAAGNVSTWALREVRDTHGNFARYCSERVSDFGLAEGHVDGWELYLSSVDYTRDPGAPHGCAPDHQGPYRVKFLRDSHVGAPRRPDVTIDGRGGFKRVTAERLRRIEVYFRGALVRAYELDYAIGAFHKSLLTSIQRFGVGNVPFPGSGHTFEYFDEVRANPTGAPAQYNGFSPAVSWDTPDDDIDTGLIVPSAVLGLFGVDEPSVLGGSVAHSAGGHLYIGFNPVVGSKTISFGGKVGFNGSQSKGVAALIDVDGNSLPDKVFRTGSGFRFRPNQAKPIGGAGFLDDTLSFSADMPLPGLPGQVSRDTSFMFSGGVEVYPFIFGILFNHSESFTRTSTYVSDVNGDGLPDLVNGGGVLFNRRTSSGGHEFTGSSTGTPFPIIPGSVDTSGLLPDFGDVRETVDSSNPLVDTVRFWVAPISGTVNVTAPVRLTHASPDGVRVAIQKNGAELWSQTINGNDLSTYTPTGVAAVSVFPGDRIYFRVGSRSDGRNDEVEWSPTIHYNGLSPTFDENGLDATQYSAESDFILGGRPGVNTVMPFTGSVRMQGTLNKTGVTSDDISVEIRKNDVSVYSASLAWSAVSSIAIDQSFSVTRDDRVQLLVHSDSRIDLTKLNFDPLVVLAYTSAVDSSGNPVTVTDSMGNPTITLAVPYDEDIYPVRIPAGLPTPWVVPLDDPDPSTDGTVTITVTATLPIFSDAPLIFTAKQTNSLVVKHEFAPIGGVPQVFSFTIDPAMGDEYFFDFTSQSRYVAFGSSTNVVAIYPPDPIIPIIFMPPHATYTVTEPDLCSRPYRGWSYAGYIPPDPAHPGDPIRHGGADGFCEINSSFDEDTDLPTDRGDLEGNVGTLDSNVTMAFAPYPGGRTCTDPTEACQIPAGALWGGGGTLSYLNPNLMSSSRKSGGDLEIPSLDDVAGAGASAPSRLSRTSDNSVSLSGGFGPISGSVSVSIGDSTGEVDFLDMNGDKFPDVVGHSGVQYTDPRGTLAERLPVVSNVRESDSFAMNAGVGGNVARAVANGRGRFSPTGSASGTTAENGSQMATLGFSLSLNGNISTNDVNSELMDINGDGLPDRLTISGGKLYVQFNLGYSFSPAEEFDGGSTINTGNGAVIGGGASLSFNDGNYGFGGGVTVNTSWQRINEWVPGLQRDGQTLADVNGDGLMDRVVADGGHYAVRFNTGNGFAGGSTWNGSQDRDITENKSTTAGAGGYFTISIGPLCLVACYLIINPGFDVGETLARPEAALQDINGDSYPDQLVSESDGELIASINNTGRTNLLKRVNRPMNAWFEVDYERKGNTFEDPHSHWVLSRTTQYDGLAGDGTDYQVKSFSYGDGFYDRFEREFYGFSEVTTTTHDTRGLPPGSLASAPAYRQTKTEYHNDSFFTRGLVRRQTILGLDSGAPLTYVVSENDYLLREVDTGGETADASLLRFTMSSVFPFVATATKRVSEGDPSIALVTQTTTTYDEFGSVATQTDTGDTVSTDDYAFTITHTGVSGGAHAACAANYIVGLPDSIVVRNAAGAVIRERRATYDCANGDLTSLTQVLDSAGATATMDITYAANGNMTSFTSPPNHNGQRYALQFTYDSDISTYVVNVTDSFGLFSDSEYDLRFGEPSSEIDSNGNTMTRTYDAFGRPATITGPYDQGSGFATITFEHHPEAPVPYARTRNLDSFRDPADPIETYLFTDGLERVVQVKKDATIFQGRTAAPTDMMVISGRITLDHVGRTSATFYTDVEAKDDTLNATFNAGYDSIAPTLAAHDVLDRVIHTTNPDGTTTSNVYTLSSDRHGTLRQTVTTTDELGNQKAVYTDVRNLVAAVKELNPTKGETIWTEYLYDPLDKPVRITDDHGNVTNIVYDLLGRETLLDNPDTGRIEHTYDAASNVIRKVTGHLAAAGAAIDYEFDFNRLVEAHYSLFPENDVTYEYGDASLRGHGGNRAGRLVRVTDESGVEERRYGKLGEVVQSTKTLASDTLGACAGCPEVWTTTYLWDTFGRLQEMTYPDTEVLTYDYDSGGLVRKVTGVKLGTEFPYVARIEYDKFDDRTFVKYGNDIETVYSRNPVTRELEQLEAGDFQNLKYERDDVGNVTRVLNDVPPTSPNEMGGRVEQVYEYDALYRLTHATGSFRYGPQKTDAYELTLDYDTIHNILSKTQDHTVQTRTNNPIPQHKTSFDWTYSYESDQPHAPSRIAGDAAPGSEDRAFSYDASGNQTGWDDLTSGQRRTIIWDEENRMQEISDNGRTTRFKYDAAGQRVIKRGAQGETAYINQYWTVRNRTVGTKHIFVGSTRLVSKLSPGTAHSNPGDLFMDALKNWYDRHSGVFPGRHVGWSRKGNPDNNFLYYYHPDHLGSTSYVTDTDGELYEHVEYFPFGESWVEENSNSERLPYLFSSKELDQETGLYYFGARYYDPRTSVWQSTDPHLADEPGSTVSNSGILAAYTYTAQNPIRLIDPSGRENEEPEGQSTTSKVRDVVDHAARVSGKLGNARVEYHHKVDALAKEVNAMIDANKGQLSEEIVQHANKSRNALKVEMRVKGGEKAVDAWAKITRGPKDMPSVEFLRSAEGGLKTDPQIVKGAIEKTNVTVNKVAKVARVAGPAMIVADVGFGVYNTLSAPEGEKGKTGFKEAGRITGALAGGLAGAKAGALIGSLGGPIGAGIGSVVGGVIGAIYFGGKGEKAGAAVGEKVLGPNPKW